MTKISKNRKAALQRYDNQQFYSLEEATKILKDITKTKFDASVDLDVKLGVDPKKANQMVRGTVALPNGVGKSVRVLVLCSPDKVNEAKEAGADHVGLDEYVEKIKGGWTDIDVIITMPSVMGKVGALGKILGPRGLMPNPKSGTVTMEIGKAVKEIKAGKIEFKVDKNGIIHTTVGRASFDAVKLSENINEIMNMIIRLKPTSSKGTYLQSVTLSSTMSPGVKIQTRALSA